MSDHYWFTLLSEIFGLFLLKHQSDIIGRKCDDVFDPFCRSGPFRAPLWQTIITLIAQFGCLSWWATDRVIGGGSSTANSAKLDGVTDAFSDLITEGPPPPAWAYALLTVPAFLSTGYLVIFHIALQSLRASTALILLMPGYLVELLFQAYMTIPDDDEECSTTTKSFTNLNFSVLIGTSTILALILAAWDEIAESLRFENASLSGAFTNTGTIPSVIPTPDVAIIAVLFGIAAGALLALRNVIFRGMLNRFEFDKNQAVGLEGVFGLIAAFTLLVFADAWKLEYSGVTIFQIFTSNYLTYSTVAYVGCWLIICLLPHRATVDYVYRAVGVITVELIFGANLQSSFLALAARACVIITAALVWRTDPLPHAWTAKLLPCWRQQDQTRCDHLRVTNEKRHTRCPLCVRELE